MAYTSPSAIRQIMRKLPTSITDKDIELQIAKADALIDGKLGGVFATPFLLVPRMIQEISTDLTVFFLTENLYSSSAPNLDEYQHTRYERALELLDEIAVGDISIGIPMNPGYESGYSTTNDQQIFNYEDPEW